MRMKQIVQWLKNLIFFSIMMILSAGSIKAANLCNSGTEIFIGAYHSSIVSTKDDFFAFGEAIAANGVNHNLTPVSIIPANGYTYTGNLLFATDATHDTQAFILTTDGLYVWGASGANTAASHETAMVTDVAFHEIAMPIGILPTDVTYLTATNGGVFLVANGKVYAQGITPDLMGDDGAAADANGWHTVQKSSGGDLTNVKFFKANYNGALAVTTTNEYYTWGTAVFLGNGTSSQTLTSATLMTAPFVGSASIIAVTGYDVTPGLSYYVLNPADTKIYVLGGNSDGQLGIGSNGNTSTSWTTVKKSSGVDLVGVIDVNADDNSDHHPTAGAIVNGYDDGSGPANDVFLVWGKNSLNALGAGSADVIYPYVPTGFIPGSSRATKIEMGGHTTMYYDPDYIDTYSHKGKMCYIGHKINGSMGDGISASSTVSTFECNETPWIPTLCAAEKPPMATDDDKIDQPSGPVTLNVVTDDNGHGIDSDADGTVDESMVDLTPLTETIDQTLVVSGEGNWSVDAAGLVTFTPDVALVGDPTDIVYTVLDNNGIKSNMATIHITYIRQISISDVAQNELHSGTSTFDFTVSINAVSATDINVTYTTNDGTATTADSDYIATSGIATILAGDTNTTVSVTVQGDTKVEGDETFTVDLSAPVGATIVDAQGVSTIENDDIVAPAPSISVEKTGTFMDEDHDGYANVGETVNYEFNVINTGNVILTNVSLADDNAVITGGPISSMIPGESDTTTFTAIHTLTWQDIIDGKVVNQAIVTGKDSHGNDVNDTSDDPQNPVDDDSNSDGEPDDKTSTGLPIEDPVSTDDTYNATTGENITIDIVNNDSGGTFTLDATTVTLIEPTGATEVVTVDGDIIGFVVPGEGTWSVDETTGEVTFSPEDGYVGDPTPIEYTIEDEQGNPTTSEITINYPPVANNDNTTADTDETVTLDVLANDQNTSDPLDPTTVRIIGPDGNEIETLDVPNEGTWTVEANGSVTFDPDPDFDEDANITYVVRETNGDVSNEASITIQYPGVPLATDNGIILITEYTPTVIDVLANGDRWGSNGSGTQVITFTGPIYGTVELDDGGTPNDPEDDVLIYIPSPDINNVTDSFTYTITDALGFTSTANVTLNVNCASSQRSDSGDALGFVSMLLLTIMTAMTGLYFIRREEERREA